jgi:CBS domain-containing protein
MLCREIMTRAVDTIGPDASAAEAARKMRDGAFGIVPVCGDDGRVLGVVTDRDLALRVCAEALPAETTRVRSVMTAEIVACRPDDPLEHAEEAMVRSFTQRILVTDGDQRLVGMISVADLAHYEEPLRVARIVRQIGTREFRLGR